MEKFNVWNMTDKICASHNAMSSSQADQFIKSFPKRYGAQGYYRNNKGEKMNPSDVELLKLPVGLFPDMSEEPETKSSFFRENGRI